MDVVIIVVLIAILGIIGMVAFTIWETKQYKYKFIVKEVTGTNRRVIVDKAKYVSKDGKSEYYLKKMKKFAPKEPSPECIEIDAKGKLVLTAYYVDDEFHYLVDETGKNEIEDAFKEANISHHIFASDQRELLINRTKRALEREKGDFLNKYGGVMILSGASVLIVVCLMIFWGDVWGPMHDTINEVMAGNERMYKMQENITAMNVETTRMLHDIIGETQIISGSVDASGLT